jgi:hypothetical protein
MSQKSSFALRGEAMLLVNEGNRELGIAIGSLFLRVTRRILALLRAYSGRNGSIAANPD